MFNIVLFEPEIPPNTGNIMRLCANSGAKLHLIEPLGFKITEKEMRRAGLDYISEKNYTIYKNFDLFIKTLSPTSKLYGISTKAKNNYISVNFNKDDYFIFGPETRGLPESTRLFLGEKNLLRIPMIPESRSINLANSVSIILYEAWRQNNFKNGT
jgi:tRNA (cytidine/uridine-2'-O-)-methyltransferase